MVSRRRLLLAAGAATVMLTLGLTGTASARSVAAASDPVAPAAVTYTIAVVTSDIEDAGTDGTVKVRLNGTAGSSNFVLLDSSKDNFERNSTDTFEPPLADLGTLESVDVNFIRGGDSPAWHLAHIRISAPGKTTKYFPAHRWFGETQFVNLRAAVNPVTYTILVTTSDVANAGTDGTVEVRLRGTLGSSPYFHLDNEDVDNFERNTTNTFSRVIGSLGTLQFVDVRFDPSGDSPHWHLSHITVRVNSGADNVFPHHEWFTIESEVRVPVAP